MWDFDDLFLDSEDIVARLEYINQQTGRNPYEGWKGQATNYGQRVERALLSIPLQHRQSALALFSSVIYLPDSLLNEAWREIAFELQVREGWTADAGFKDSFFLAVDDAGLVGDFGHMTGIEGREDRDKNPDFGTVSDLIAQLKIVLGLGQKDADVLYRLRVACSKNKWILLTDNAISGGSLKSDIEKLSIIIKTLFSKHIDGEYPRILVCAQIITDQALEDVGQTLPSEQIYYGMRFDETFRVTSDKCALFHNTDSLTGVRDLCEWFGDTYFVQHLDDNFRKRLEIHKGKGGKHNYAYGWRDCGYTIVTKTNCLSNSIPVLYYPGNSQNGVYNPPFPRTESRETHVTSHDREDLKMLTEPENAATIREAIFGESQIERA
ncbi:MAG: phosphoribosyltransferase-like protein [Aggregatilineales bacterium]